MYYELFYHYNTFVQLLFIKIDQKHSILSRGDIYDDSG